MICVSEARSTAPITPVLANMCRVSSENGKHGWKSCSGCCLRIGGRNFQAFKRALRADQLDIARGDAALMQAWGLRLIRQLWMAKPSEKEREFVQCLFLNTLLQLPHY